MDFIRGAFGMLVLIGVCYLLSSNRKAISWRLVISGLVIQFILAILILKIPFVRKIFDSISSVFVAILRFTEEGSKFLFGNIISDINTFGYIFAFQVLPTVVFFSAFSAILYYLGILQKIIYVFAWVMSKTMRLSGAESLAAAANVFIGQTEAPLVVKPYLDNMTRSEMLCLMTGGMSTIAGGVFAAYVGYLGGSDPVQQQIFATHLLTASIISAPAAVLVAKMLYPEDQPDKINTNLEISKDKIGSNLLDAISKGTTDGLKLAVNVGVMLLVFTALVYMFNQILMGTLGEWTGLNEYVVTNTNGRFEGFTFTYVLGIIFAPIAWLLGVASQDIVLIGQLLGQKTVINEFIAYAELGLMRKNPDIFLQPKSIIIATYALCGFANFASIGIQIGGIGAIAPKQRRTLSEFGIKALIGGTIACFLTAAIAGMLVVEPQLDTIEQQQAYEIYDIDDLTFEGGTFQTPLKRFLGTMGSPDEVGPIGFDCGYFSEVDTNVVQYLYGQHVFNVYDGWAEIGKIDFTDSVRVLSVNHPALNLDGNTTLEALKTAFPESYKSAETLTDKEGTALILKLLPEKNHGGRFKLTVRNEKLTTLEFVQSCPKNSEE